MSYLTKNMMLISYEMSDTCILVGTILEKGEKIKCSYREHHGIFIFSEKGICRLGKFACILSPFPKNASKIFKGYFPINQIFL